jgi:hypothetical protein
MDIRYGGHPNLNKYDISIKVCVLSQSTGNSILWTADPEQFLDPVNPNFGGFDFAQPEDRGIYQPGPWGTFDLVKIIPNNQLSEYRDPSGEFTYAWEDDESLVGFTYWYYVSAYKEGNYTGPGGETTTHLETSNFNRNGAVGIWQGTYPFSDTSPDFPANTGR